MSDGGLQPHMVPQPPEGLLLAAAEREGPFLVVEGQYSPKPSQTVRAAVLCRGRVIAEQWIAPQDLADAVDVLADCATVRTGEWDVMYATDWELAWTTDGPPLEVWESSGQRLVWQEGSDLVVRGGERCSAASIERVHLYLRQGWLVRGVRCVLTGGRELEVHEVTDPIAGIDFTYGELELVCDTSWAVSLARAIGSAFEVPVDMDDPL